MAVANVPGYSTYSVAQMTFSLLLAICQCAQRYDRAVKAGYCAGHPGRVRPAAAGGAAGQDPAHLRLRQHRPPDRPQCAAFGNGAARTCSVRPEYAADGVEFVDFDTLLARSDVLSLHRPPPWKPHDHREALYRSRGAIY